MPLDNVPSRKIWQIYQKKTIKFIKKLKKIKDAKCYPTNSKLSRFFKKTVSYIMFPVSFKMLNKWMDNTMKLSKKNTGYLCSMASHFSYEKQTFENDVYGTAKLLSFENRHFYVPNRIEYYLTRLYGDYMKLPPISVQEQQMEFIKEVDLW